MIKGDGSFTDSIAWAEDVIAGFEHLHSGYMLDYLSSRLKGYLSLYNSSINDNVLDILANNDVDGFIQKQVSNQILMIEYGISRR
jgi:hypothetical protein